MLRMKALTDGTKKVRTEARKLPPAAAAAAAAAMAMAPNGSAGPGLSGTDLSRARVKARMGRVCSSDALMELSGGQLGGHGYQQQQQQQPSSGAATNSGGTNGSPGSGTGTGSPWGSQSQGQGPMQRIDEEGCGSADGAAGKQAQGAGPTGMSVDGAHAAMSLQHQLILRRAHSSSMVEGHTLASLMAARHSASQLTAPGSDGNRAAQQPQPQATPASACAGLQAQPAGQQGASPAGQDSLADCVITDQDLAALGFDDLPQLSNPLSNGANVSTRTEPL